MPHRSLFRILVLYLLLAGGQSSAQQTPLTLSDYQSFEGFIDTWWDEETGRMLVRVEEFDTPFIYQSSLPRGVGSRPISCTR